MAQQLQEPTVDRALAREHGLTDEEFDRLIKALGRTPTFTELGIVSVMWSEHCSYKSSRRLLATLPTEGPAVLQGPGENAGAVHIGDGEAVVFKIESHNHPSAVMPYQGATTGVGGILRDIFTMGARPIALLNSLRFGDPAQPGVKRMAEEIVRGIADYGNCVGVPTVAGEVYFHPCYAANPLVNAMCVGRVRADRLTRAAARTVGAKVVYFGNPTGRDGVHGATFASEELSEATLARKSAVQVGDPFMGKKILEATLELIEAGAVEAIQDMGAAGLTCSSCEMGGRGGLGVRLALDRVPLRVPGLTPYDIMLSESQERMLAVCGPDRLPQAREILRKWDLEAHVVGEVTEGGELAVEFQGREVARLPNALMTRGAPVYDLPQAPRQEPDAWEVWHPDRGPTSSETLRAAALELLGTPTIASKRWIFEQYDHQVQTQTVIKPGGSAAVLRLKGTDKYLALTVDGNGLFCHLDPREGARIAVAEAARNLVCVGARPLAVTNCLNFGNPTKPSVFRQFAEVVAGMGEACRALGTPVTGGNVSFYNESPDGAIFPTPVIGMIGLIHPPLRPLPPGFPEGGLDLWLLGPDPQTLGGSLYAQRGSARPVGPCPRIDLDRERHVQAFVLALHEGGLIRTAQDLSEGGLWIALAEGALQGDLGARLERAPDEQDPTLWLFAEDPSRVLVAAEPELGELIWAEARVRGIGCRRVGQTGGQGLAYGEAFGIDLEQARQIYYDEPGGRD